MKILAVETATEACSAAVIDGERVVRRYQMAPQAHNRLILPMVDEVLAEAGITLAELDGLAFGRGPGSFTGVRIAAGVIQGLAIGTGLQVAPVSTLAALAQAVFDETDADWAFPCIDARMGEVYFGVYRRGAVGLAEAEGLECVLPAANIRGTSGSTGIGIGSGWTTYEAVLRERLGDSVETVLANRFPDASLVAKLGEEIFRHGLAVDAALAQPVYLRDDVARKPAPKDPAAGPSKT